jgi:hypothetical protein
MHAAPQDWTRCRKEAQQGEKDFVDECKDHVGRLAPPNPLPALQQLLLPGAGATPDAKPPAPSPLRSSRPSSSA